MPAAPPGLQIAKCVAFGRISPVPGRLRGYSIAMPSPVSSLPRSWFPWVLWALATYLAFGRSYLLAFNLTDSLPGTFFLIERNMPPERGDLVAFRWQGNWPYPEGSVFVKRLIGLPGAVVAATGRDFFVDGNYVGHAKKTARTGELLAPGPVGTIPDGQYYVAGSHPDSLDSRYRLTGWVSRQQIVGRAHRIL